MGLEINVQAFLLGAKVNLPYVNAVKAVGGEKIVILRNCNSPDWTLVDPEVRSHLRLKPYKLSWLSSMRFFLFKVVHIFINSVFSWHRYKNV